MQDKLSYRQIFENGLWKDNPGLVLLLGLCPLLAVSNTIVNGLGLAIGTIAVLVSTNVVVSATRGWIHHDVRLPTFILVIATFVTVVELLFKALAFDLYLNLGIFIPLIVTNCVILGRAEAFASRQPVVAALVDGLAYGIGFAVGLILLGGMREIIGQGSLFRGAETLLGPWGANLEISFSSEPTGLLLAMLPPGAFIGLAVLIALRNIISRRSAARETDSDSAQTDLTT